MHAEAVPSPQSQAVFRFDSLCPLSELIFYSVRHIHINREQPLPLGGLIDFLSRAVSAQFELNGLYDSAPLPRPGN